MTGPYRPARDPLPLREWSRDHAHDSRPTGDTRRPDFPSYVYLPNPLGHIQGYDRSGGYAGWLGRTYDALATRIPRRGPDEKPYFRACRDDELDFRIQGLDGPAVINLDRTRRR